jgi:hypothetical protein
LDGCLREARRQMGDRPLPLRQGEVRKLESRAKPFRDSPLGLIKELEGQMAFHRQRRGKEK